MSIRSLSSDLSTSMIPILGPLSGGSWMTISPLAAVKSVFSGRQPPPPSETVRSEAKAWSSPENNTPVPVEVIRVPLNENIWMEIKSSSKDDLLMGWELADLRCFIDGSLENYETFDPDIDQKFIIGDMFQVELDTVVQPRMYSRNRYR